jgi:hypothetical protein
MIQTIKKRSDVRFVCPPNYILYWKNPGYLYNKEESLKRVIS